MNNILDCLEYYNIEREGNYYWIKDEDFVGTDLNIVFPIGYLANDKFLLDIYGELLIDQLSINTQKAYYTYSLGPTHFNIKIRVMDINITPMIMISLWNTLNNFNNTIEYHLKNPLINHIIKTKIDSKLSFENSAIENMVNVDNSVRSLLSNKDAIKSLLENSSNYIIEKNAFVIYRGKYKLIHFDRDIKELILPKYITDLNIIKKEGILVKFNSEEEVLIVKEVLSLTNQLDVSIKYYNDDIYLFIKGDRKEIIDFIKLFIENINKLIDQVSYNQMQAIISFRLNSLVNKLKKDTDLLIDQLLFNRVIISNDLDCLLMYKYDKEYVKDLILGKLRQVIKEG